MKRSWKVAVSLLLTFALIFSFAACAPKEEAPAEEPAAGAAEVAIILKTEANPFWVAMKEGIQAEADKQGVKVDIYAAQAEDDLQGQLNLFETAISKGYKAIGVAPLSPVNLNTAIVKANEAGIYVGNIDEKVDMEQLKGLGGSVLFFVTTDNVAVGAKGAQYIIDNVPAGSKVAIVEGKAGNASGNDRRDGAKAAFEAAGLTIVDSQPADWDRAKALEVATNMLQKNPDIAAIYCCNDTMALGVQQAVENAALKDKVKVVGTDGAPEAYDSIKNGGMAATVAQDPGEIGAESFRLLLQALKDQPAIDPNVIPDRTPVDSKLVTAADL